MNQVEAFSKSEQDVFYRILRARRDIRKFSSKPVKDDILRRIFEAAHTAPSVGFMQPWDFILISDKKIRQQIKSAFEEQTRADAEKILELKRKSLYKSLKLEGIMESYVNVAVTCDRERGGPFVLGRNAMPEMDLYSTCLAIQNMWLAARVEGVGIGWVSILDRKVTEEILNLPKQTRLVAYLCLGYPKEFRDKPLLEEIGWRKKVDLKTMVHRDRWGEKTDLFSKELVGELLHNEELG